MPRLPSSKLTTSKETRTALRYSSARARVLSAQEVHAIPSGGNYSANSTHLRVSRIASLLRCLFKAVSVSPRSNDSDGAPNDKAARFCALHAYLELHSAVAPPSLLAGNVSLMCMKIANEYPQGMGSGRARSLRKSMQEVFEHRLKLSKKLYCNC